MQELRRLWGRNIEQGRKRLSADGTRFRADDEAPMSQTTLAEHVDVTQQTVSDWEAGRTAPRDEHKVKVATVLHQDVHQVFPLVRPTAGVR